MRPTVTTVVDKDGVHSFPLIRIGEDANRFGAALDEIIIEFFPDRIYAHVFNMDGGGHLNRMTGKVSPWAAR